MQKILSSDLLIADIMIPLPEDISKVFPSEQKKYRELTTLLDGILARQHVKRGQKGSLKPEEYRQLSEAISGLRTNGTEAGGSSANTLTTLGNLLNEHVDIDFIGIAGVGFHTNIIRSGLDAANINLIEGRHPHDAPPESALSFVFTEENGKRTIVTYPGNAKEFFPPHVANNLDLPEHDIVFVQGSLWQKFHKGSGMPGAPDELGLADKLVTHRWQKNKEIWLALPTCAKFSDDMVQDSYRYLIASADVVLGNREELMRIYETDDFDKAIKALQQQIAERDGIKHRHGKNSRKEAVAFITCGKDGAIVVTPTHTERVPAAALSGGPIYELGAGDTSYAGFLAGHMAELTPKESAQLGMELAGAKLQYNSARIPDPKAALQARGGPAVALWQKVEDNLAAQGQDHAGHRHPLRPSRASRLSASAQDSGIEK